MTSYRNINLSIYPMKNRYENHVRKASLVCNQKNGIISQDHIVMLF